MAKVTLPVNYQDDIMNSSMDGKRRYKMINHSDGTVSFEDATTYDQVGSNFGAGQMNATNQAVNESLDKNKVVRDLETIGAITEEGYVPDALALQAVNNSLGGYEFFTNPTVVSLVSDGSLYTDTNGNHVLANSTTGETLLADTATYTTGTAEGNFFKVAGADSVIPFKKGATLKKLELSLTYGSVDFTFPESGEYTLLLVYGAYWGGNNLNISTSIEHTIIDKKTFNGGTATAYAYMVINVKVNANDTLTINCGSSSNILLTRALFG